MGGASATAFAARQGQAAHTLVAGLRRSSDALAALRDDLARAVAGKVEAVLAAGDQLAGRRETWTAASRTVLGGSGDRAVASEIVDQQVKPFVDSVVVGEVSAVLRDATNSAANSYDSAISVVRGAPVTFELPEAWPMSSPRPVEFSASTAPVAQVAPAIGSAATAPTIPAALVTAVPAAAPTPAPAAVAGPTPESALPMSAPAPASAPAAAAGPGDLGIGSAAGGLGRQLADIIGGTLGSAAGLVPDAAALGDGVEVPEKPDGTDDPKVDEKTADEKTADEEDQAAEEPTAPEPSGDPQPQPDPAPAATQAEDPPPPTPPPSVIEPPAPQPDKTPCQIAADELPQVGD